MDGDEIIVPSRHYSDSAETQQKTLSDVLDELCAYYMLCGVSCDEYWNGDYTKFKYYPQIPNCDKLGVLKHEVALH